MMVDPEYVARCSERLVRTSVGTSYDFYHGSGRAGCSERLVRTSVGTPVGMWAMGVKAGRSERLVRTSVGTLDQRYWGLAR